MKQFFGLENKYGRPVPYVWFIIILVSSMPLFILGAVQDAIPCIEEEILNGRTNEEYLKQKGFTIEEALTKCTELTEGATIAGKVVSAMMFGSLLIVLKPWPLSGYKEESKKPWKAMPKGWGKE